MNIIQNFSLKNEYNEMYIRNDRWVKIKKVINIFFNRWCLNIVMNINEYRINEISSTITLLFTYGGMCVKQQITFYP